jgi:hypothetical protein
VGKRWTWVAWSMLAIFLLTGAITIPLTVANGSTQEEPGFIVALGVAFTAFMVVGAVIVAHRPGNAIGWIFSAIGLLAATGMLAMEYAAHAYVTSPGSLPAAILAAWYHWWWDPMLGLILVFTPLLFPTGRLLSVRWRPVAVAAGSSPAAARPGPAPGADPGPAARAGRGGRLLRSEGHCPRLAPVRRSGSARAWVITFWNHQVIAR